MAVRSQADPEKQPVYAAAERFVEAALRSDGSLFEPDRKVWSAPVLADLYERFNLAPDETGDSFEAKFQRQLSGASAATVQLAAELLYVHFLIARDIGGSTKRRLIDHVSSWSPEPFTRPGDLDAALDLGICTTGIAFKTYRPQQLWFLIDLLRGWKALADDTRGHLLADAWRFKEWAESIPIRAAFAQRQAVLHLLFPAAFEDMVSRDHKALIVKALADELPGSVPEDPDRALAALRAQLAPRYGTDFSFYSPEVVGSWRGTTKESVAAKPVSSTSSTQRAWLIRGTGEQGSFVPRWIAEGYCSIGWFELGELPFDIERAALVERLRVTFPEFSEGAYPVSAGIIIRFLQVLSPGDLVLTPNGSDLYIGVIDGDVEYDEREVPHPWRRPVEWFNPQAPIKRDQVSSALHSKLRSLLTLTDLSENVHELQALATGSTLPTTEISPDPSVTSPALAEAPAALAERLHVPKEWLDEQIELLRRKRQIVLYGPPGTGKTYLAQALADHLATDGGAKLVQFHPSYAYEDFFEGFRPRSTGEGTIGFELVRGPFRELADAARSDRGNPYVLVIDEINRANLAKVFGELYFLLEYRDRSITLQYSAEEFQLPKNVYVIGTMNTVDRSIALVDSAMRRRFYFTPLFPGRPPVMGMLRAWLRAHDLTLQSAELLERLNERIGDPDAAIGPSYFMLEDIDDPECLRRVWEHAVIPQLEEHHFGSGVDVDARYNLEHLLRGVPDQQEAVLEPDRDHP